VEHVLVERTAYMMDEKREWVFLTGELESNGHYII
jgi:hypothetical protein